MQSIIIRSLLEFPQKLSEFENAFHLKIFEPLYQKFITKIYKLEHISLATFEAELSEDELKSEEYIKIASAVPELDFLEYEKPLKKVFMLKEQESLARLLLKASSEKTLLNLENLQSDFSEIYTSSFLSFLEWEQRYNEREQNPQIKSGVSFLDQALDGGFEMAQLVLISGDPEMGKTSLCLQVIENISRLHKVAFFCFEFTIWDYIKKRQNNTHFNKENLIILNEGYNIFEMENNIRILAKKGVKVFFIDSQMRVENNNEGNNPEERETMKFSVLAKLCHKLDILILMVVQTSKSDTENPLGSKRASHEASIIMRLEKVECDKHDLSHKNKAFHPSKRKFIMQKNKQTGKHFVEEVGFKQVNQSFYSLYDEGKKMVQVDFKEIQATLNLNNDEPF
ncbi:hypothetical protein EZU46_08015 [Campylobacter upsaliensis]|nr:hypothetical protein [Campylobacter upsaliensis]EAI8238621.1 hypothetical protein [Campylobacter upsaliensis]EAJ0412458.1 hypothetical protein [Campylobacter upsaliensis]EAJ1422523.1 hypothetical protein [Campylobacter upsaliensis]EAK3667378.1 hypothetical protein [Campylobacter upsaliensis]